MQIKHIFVLIHIRIKGEVGTVKHVLALQYILYLRATFVDLFCYLCVVFVCQTVLSVPCSLAGKGLTSCLSCM